MRRTRVRREGMAIGETAVMIRMRSALFVLSAMLLTTAGCGTGTSQATVPAGKRDAAPSVTAAPTVWPFSPPRATPTPAPVVKASGHALTLRAHDSTLEVVPLDGGEPELLAQSDPNCGGPCFGAGDDAGSASVGGVVYQYYTHAVRGIESPIGIPAAYYELRRVPVAGGASSVVATFDAYDKPPIASVSPDGKHIAYAGVDGVQLKDVATGADTLLLRDDIDPKVGARRAYLQPRWSPRGDWLVTSVGGQEGANALLVRPLDAAPHEIELQVGGNFANWSPDGSQLCLSATGYDLGDAGVMSPDDRVFHNLTSPLGPDIGSLSCAWSPSGELAISYRRHDDSAGIAFYSADGALRHDVDHFWHYASVAGWLPDGSAPVASWQDADGSSHAGVVHADGATRALPVDDVSQVLAVLP